MKPAVPATLRRLVMSSIVYVVLSLIATGIALAENRPAEFGGSSTGLPVLQDFLFGQGTAMSPPLYWLVAQVVLSVLSPRRDRWGAVGVIGLAIFGLLLGIGALGEPIFLETFSPATFNLPKAVIQAGMIVVALLMMVLGIIEGLRRRRER
jgi:hypothetical protein